MAGGVFWLAVWFGLVWLLRQVPGAGSSVLGWMQFVVGVGLIGLAVPLLWRMIHKHLLWSLRNKLILTYLLIGLAPFALVVTFVTISAYIAAGQFSIHLADTRMRQELDQMGQENSVRAERADGGDPEISRRAGRGRPEVGRGLAGDRRMQARRAEDAAAAAKANTGSTAAEAALSAVALPDPLRARLHPHTAIYLNGAPLESVAGFAHPPRCAGRGGEDSAGAAGVGGGSAWQGVSRAGAGWKRAVSGGDRPAACGEWRRAGERDHEPAGG